MFILSAGWGLVRADYLLPDYDITFSTQAALCNRRRRNDQYQDFNALRDCSITAGETIYFFGGKHYLELYHPMTSDIAARKVVYHAEAGPTRRPGYEYIAYPSFTNWQYRCVKDFIAGEIAA